MRVRRIAKIVLAVVGAALALGVVVVAIVTPHLLELLVRGDDQALSDGPEAPVEPDDPAVLVIALDGVDRALLYDTLRAGELPVLARLLGGDGFAHAYFDDTALAPMPTSTLASWATIFTGAPPAMHGVAGNEYFIRREQRFVAPAPISLDAPDLVLQTYTDDYANDLLHAPTLYEQLRDGGPPVTAWVAMSQFFTGADRLILADRTVLADAFAVFLDDDEDDDDLELFEAVDAKVVDNVIAAIEADGTPHLLTVYLSGADQFAHSSDEGPDPARRRYLREVLEGLLARLEAALEADGALANRYVVVVSDHGHTEVPHDDVHALATSGDDDPPALLRAAGYHLRPFEVEVPAGVRYDAVLAYGGALAYLYLADRSTCTDEGCAWARPPRFREDVVPIAERFLDHPAIDLVLVRGADRGFAVYTGGGRTESLAAHLARHPRRGYVAVEDRLRELAIGPYGDHAGDVVLLARNGAEPNPRARYYFSKRYYSWHGSPSARDSEIPLIIAHRRRTTAALRASVRELAGARTDATEITPLVLRLLGRRTTTAHR